MEQDEKGRGRALLVRIADGMAVVDPQGTRVGTVAGVEGGHLKIVRLDEESRNAHRVRRARADPNSRRSGSS